MSTYLSCLTETSRVGADDVCFRFRGGGGESWTVAGCPPSARAMIDISLYMEM